jgi:hypothetical protein
VRVHHLAVGSAVNPYVPLFVYVPHRHLNRQPKLTTRPCPFLTAA